MKALGLVWLMVPVVALVELGAHLHFARVAPSLSRWREVRSAVAALRRASEPVVVAPAWAEPNARHAFGDALMPLEQVARADLSSFPRALEVSILGEHAAELAEWRLVTEERQGDFLLRVLDNPAPARVVVDFLQLLPRAEVAVALPDGGEAPCPWTRTARATAGGLHGHPAFPAERARCAGAEHAFVGVTVIEDQHYRPRRCVWAHPTGSGALRIRFPPALLGTRLRGYTGLPWMVERDRRGEPILLRVFVDGDAIGSVVHRDGDGWAGFELATGRHAARMGSVTLSVEGSGAADREFCFQLDAR